jgi:hypothetical protein
MTRNPAPAAVWLRYRDAYDAVLAACREVRPIIEDGAYRGHVPADPNEWRRLLGLIDAALSKAAEGLHS